MRCLASDFDQALHAWYVNRWWVVGAGAGTLTGLTLDEPHEQALSSVQKVVVCGGDLTLTLTNTDVR